MSKVNPPPPQDSLVTPSEKSKHESFELEQIKIQEEAHAAM
jgi:hypothetical protein